MSKRRGFTLTEIVVVIALTSLVLAMVGGCLYFVSTYSGTLISKSEELTKVQTIETYLRGQVQKNGFTSLINSSDGKQLTNNPNIYIGDDLNLINGGAVVVKNTGLSKILIYQDDSTGFVRCLLKFQSDNEYTFILGIVEKNITP